MIKKIREKINAKIDESRKEEIFVLAKELGKDADGDIIYYKGTVYFVNVLHDYIKIIKVEKRKKKYYKNYDLIAKRRK